MESLASMFVGKPQHIITVAVVFLVGYAVKFSISKLSNTAFQPFTFHPLAC